MPDFDHLLFLGLPQTFLSIEDKKQPSLHLFGKDQLVAKSGEGETEFTDHYRRLGTGRHPRAGQGTRNKGPGPPVLCSHSRRMIHCIGDFRKGSAN